MHGPSSKISKPKTGLKRTGFKRAQASFTPKNPPSLAEQAKTQKEALKKRTLKVLEKATREAAENGVILSEWEGDFIQSVSERVKTYGRAFADPDLGAHGGTLSLRQGLKLKEIRRKSKK